MEKVTNHKKTRISRRRPFRRALVYSLLKAEKTETFQEANDQDYQENETERRQADDGGNSLDSVQPPVGIGRHHFDHRKWSKQGALENICRIAF